jgi:hypothetical protein
MKNSMNDGGKGHKAPRKMQISWDKFDSSWEKTFSNVVKNVEEVEQKKDKCSNKQ